MMLMIEGLVMAPCVIIYWCYISPILQLINRSVLDASSCIYLSVCQDVAANINIAVETSEDYNVNICRHGARGGLR